MLTLIKAELLKTKRTFLQKLMFLSPLLVLILPGVMTPQYVIISGYNWWYTLILPAMIALFAALLNQYESKKLKNKAIFCLPIDPGKIWLSKIIVLTIFLFGASVIHFLGLLCSSTFLPPQNEPFQTPLMMFLASLVLCITYLWQIPFCLYLARHLKLIGTMLCNVFMGIALNIAMVNRPIWFLSPYAWGSRSMVHILHIMPNGLPTESGEAILMNSPSFEVGLSLLLSLALTVIISLLTARSFRKLEAK